ncbi:hypothetical protein [Saccharothrix sp. HUAS TT1]|uniref:hypothetical protein n=1 Tax=unclassified Saccharothrix TaxID=2593673 RepID=UPI00345BC0EE
MSPFAKLRAELRAELRQRRHHRAFRIPPPVADDGLREQLERLLADVRDPVEHARPRQLDEKLLADAATNLWRAQRRLARAGEPSTPRDRQAARHLTTCRDALTDAGLVVQEHDGDAFHPGRSLEVLVFEADPARSADVVVETVRPTVYLHDRRIQLGQVIVAGPPPDGQTTSTQPRDQVRNDHA